MKFISINMRTLFGISLCGLAFIALQASTRADDLYVPGSWPHLVSDRTAYRVGDSLTVVIQEESRAGDTTRNTNEGDAGFAGQYSANKTGGDSRIGLNGNYNHNSNGQIIRSGHMVARIGVTVESILSNGDLQVSGDQLIDINGKKIQIHLSGRVRREDISSENFVLSTSLADANIVYGDPNSAKKHGFLKNIFPWARP